MIRGGIMAFDYYSSYDTVEQKRKILESVGGITKITPSSLEEKECSEDIISRYEDLESFEILNDNGVDIILRYKKEDPKVYVSEVLHI